jgi:hypothetical protein
MKRARDRNARRVKIGSRQHVQRDWEEEEEEEEEANQEDESEEEEEEVGSLAFAITNWLSVKT